MILRPHQQHVLSETERLRSEGCRRLCVTAPTGAGKSLIMVEEAIRAVNQGQRVGLFTPRKLLTDQIIGYFEDRRVPFSVRAAGYEDLYDEHRNIQICSVRTEDSRVNKSLKLPSLDANLLLLDEIHMLSKGRNRQVIEQNYAAGADLIGYTATPVGLRSMFEQLVIGGTPSELRKAGFLLPAHMYEVGTPDLKKIKREPTGEFNATQLRDSGYVQSIVGHVIKHYKRLNPHGLPTILFAPGLPESKWFVDQFAKAGLRFAHIDGEDLYIDGQEIKRSPDAKDQLLADVKSGRVQGICNRFVCREGVDIPELYYGILACPIGSLTSYLQAIGRLLRPDPNNPGMRNVRIADHGGNKDRHGSPNEDRQWEALWGLSSPQIESSRQMDIQSGKQDKGFSCPGCGLVWGRIPASGVCECGRDLSRTYKCHECDHVHRTWPVDCLCANPQCRASLKGVRKKAVIEESGDLVYVPDSDYAPKRRAPRDASEKLWRDWYYRWLRSQPQRSMQRAWGLFCLEHWKLYKCAPPRNLKLMPKDHLDWHIPIQDVPKSRLY